MAAINGPTGQSGAPTAAQGRARLVQQLFGLFPAQVMTALVELGVPEQLDAGARTTADLAAATGSHEPSLRRLLRAAVALGLVEHQDSSAVALTETGALLRPGVCGSVRNLVLLWGGEHGWRSWGRLGHSVRTGRTAHDDLYGRGYFDGLADPERQAVFVAAMAEIARVAAPGIAAAVPLARHQRLVDVGGGSGTLLAELLVAHPHLTGVLFDLPASVAEGRAVLEKAGVADRAETVDGSFFEYVPPGADAYLLKSVLHDWDDEPVFVAVLRACRAAMADDAVLYVVEPVVPDRDEDLGRENDVDQRPQHAGVHRGQGAHQGRVRRTAGGLRPHAHRAAAVPASGQPERPSGEARMTARQGTPPTAAGAPAPGGHQPAPLSAAVRDLVLGHWKAETVRVLLRLGIADVLGDHEMTAADLARRVGADADALRRAMVLACSLGVFDQVGADRFRGNPVSALLRRDHHPSMHAEACHALSGWAGTAWHALDHAVLHAGSGFRHATGTDVFSHLADHPEEAEAFHAFQAHVTRRNAAALLARYRFPAGATVVDVGGGSGTLLSAVLADRSDLRGVLLDRAPALSAAAGALDATGAADRVRLVAGDFFHEVPAGGDVYVLSHVLHDWPDHDARRILDRVRAAMPAQARLLVLENALAEPPDLLVAYLDVLMMTAFDSAERSPDQYRDLLGAAGFTEVAEQVLHPHGRLTLFEARPCGTA